MGPASRRVPRVFVYTERTVDGMGKIVDKHVVRDTRRGGFEPQAIPQSLRRRKGGFGIMEVLISAFVLGILYAAVSSLQEGNREALLRIRGRDGATEVAQNIIDSLGALGLASFNDENLLADGSLAKKDEEGNLVKDEIQVVRTWEGQPGLVQNTMSVTYTVDVKVTPDEEFEVKSGSYLLGTDCTEETSNCATHVYAKRLDVTVSWPFKNSTQSINVSGVIR